MNGINFGCATEGNNCSCLILLLLLLCGGCNFGMKKCGDGEGCDICTVLVIMLLLGAI